MKLFSCLRLDSKVNSIDLVDYTLILPLISTGNVGQLAIDLIISYGYSSQTIEHAGSIESDLVLPVCGYETYPGRSSELVTAIDLYIFKELRLVIMQQRSQVILSFEDAFAEELVSWCKESEIKEILALSGADSIAMGGNPIELRSASSILCYTTNTVSKATEEKCSTHVSLISAGASELKFEPFVDLSLQPGGLFASETFALDEMDRNQDHFKFKAYAGLNNDDDNQAFLNFPSGTGICRNLVRTVLSTGDKNLNLTVVMLPCNEGDNTPDSALLAEVVGKCMKIVDKDLLSVKWVTPLSWNYLYGTKPEDESMW